MKAFAALVLCFGLVGCVTTPAPAPVYYPVPSNRVVAPLDSDLARPCALPPFEETDNYDDWQEYWQEGVLGAFAACANRLNRVVDLWAAEVRKNPAAAPVVVPVDPAIPPVAPASSGPAWPPIRNSGG